MNTIAELYQRIDDFLVVIGALVVALHATIGAAKAMAQVLGKLALVTQTKADDEAIAKLSFGLARAHDTLERFQRWLPRARLGKVKEPMVGTSIRPPPARESSETPHPPSS